MKSAVYEVDRDIPETERKFFPRAAECRALNLERADGKLDQGLSRREILVKSLKRYQGFGYVSCYKGYQAEIPLQRQGQGGSGKRDRGCERLLDYPYVKAKDRKQRDDWDQRTDLLAKTHQFLSTLIGVVARCSWKGRGWRGRCLLQQED